MGTQMKPRKNLEGALFTYIQNTLQTQSAVSIFYKLIIWTYVVRLFQVPHTLLGQALF